MPVACHRTGPHAAAAGPPSEGGRGSVIESRRGYSSSVSPVRLMPLMEGLRGRMRHLAVFSPGVETVVDDETRQMSEGGIGGGDGGAIGGGARQQFASGLHHRLLR